MATLGVVTLGLAKINPTIWCSPRLKTSRLEYFEAEFNLGEHHIAGMKSYKPIGGRVFQFFYGCKWFWGDFWDLAKIKKIIPSFPIDVFIFRLTLPNHSQSYTSRDFKIVEFWPGFGGT